MRLFTAGAGFQGCTRITLAQPAISFAITARGGVVGKKTIISLCDYTGIFTQPWRDAGYEALHVDPQRENNGTILDMMPSIRQAIIKGACFVAGFPPCTDVAVSGAAHFASKLESDKYCQAKAALVAEQCRMIGEIAGCPWFFENPVSVFSSIFGKPNFTFNPSDFGGYLPEDDKHPKWPEYIAERDAYPKKTCLWSGGGFELPEKRPVSVRPGYSDQHKKLGGKSLKTKNIRSATPRGFAKAIFEKYGACNA